MNSLEVEVQQKPLDIKVGWNHWRKMKLYSSSKGKVVLSIGPHWCGPVVTTLVIMFVFTLNGVIIERSKCTEATKESLFYLALVICIVGQLLMMCTALCDSGTLVSGPGDEEESASLVGKNDGVPYCDSCQIYQINNAAHCTFCDCCVEELDHHCPWMGKCIGKGNMFWFKCFMAIVVIFLIQFAIVGLKYS